MNGGGLTDDEVFAFIVDKIDTVPHLEALLLLWKTRPQSWSVSDVGARLYIIDDAARRLLEDLVRNGLIAADEKGQDFRYGGGSETTDRLVNRVNEVYRTQLVRVSTMIHSKASAAVRDFARAFRFTKDRS